MVVEGDDCEGVWMEEVWRCGWVMMEMIEWVRGCGDVNDGTTSRREARGDANERSETTASEDVMEMGG